MKVAQIALVVAIPIEIANFFLAGFPLDTGFEPVDPWYAKVIGYQWLVLHFSGRAVGWLAGWHGFGKMVGRSNQVDEPRDSVPLGSICEWLPRHDIDRPCRAARIPVAGSPS
jgi:hypothetical protein